MADWAVLPRDLLALISKRLDSPFDIIHFRSVCSTWRSAAERKSRRPAVLLPILPDNGGGLFPDSAAVFRLSRRSIFLIGLKETRSRREMLSWMVKVEEDVDGPGKVILFDPLGDRQIRLPDGFPRVLDLSRFRVRELGQEFKLHYSNRVGNIVDSLYLEKAVVKYLDDGEKEFVLLTIHVSGKLAVFKSWNRSWAIIHDMPSPYDDVILFDGQLYAVDNNGRTVVVDFLSLKLRLAANPVFGGDKKFLVESCGELLLVDMYLSIEAEEEAPGYIEEFFEHLAYYMNERTVKFKVFKFDEREKGWAEVGNLGERMLFLGDDCSFSASASDLSPLCRGGSVFFNGNVFNGEDYGAVQDRDIGVFEFETGKIEPLRKRPGYAKMFWPPPRWINSSMSEQAQDQPEETS